MTDPPHGTDRSRELAVAIDAAERAAAAVMRVYGTAFTVSYKDHVNDDPVTAADREANTLIVEALRNAFPEDAIVAEESALPDGFERVRRCWFVDPLDGTKEFVDRNGEFCVMIGLAVDGRAVLGVVAVPALEGGFLLAGEVGVGAHRRPLASLASSALSAANETQLRVSTRDEPSAATIVVSRSRRSPLLDAILHALGSPRELACGSVGVKIGKLVTGEADAYVHPASARRDGGPKRWDTCAPEAIVLAAGGAFTDGLGRPIDYASRDIVNRDGLVASNGVLHARLISAVKAAQSA